MIETTILATKPTYILSPPFTKPFILRFILQIAFQAKNLSGVPFKITFYVYYFHSMIILTKIIIIEAFTAFKTIFGVEKPTLKKYSMYSTARTT